MAIHAGQIERGSSLREPTFRMLLAPVAIAANAYYASTPLNGITVPLTAPAAIGSWPQWTRSPISLAVTFTIATGRSVTIRIVGENQFGDVITEDVVCNGNTTAVVLHTLNCFRLISSVHVTAISAGMAVGDVLAIGNQIGATMRFPLWSRTIPSVAIKAISYDTGTLATVPAGASLIVDSTRATVRDTTTTLVQGSWASLYIDPKFERYV